MQLEGFARKLDIAVAAGIVDRETSEVVEVGDGCWEVRASGPLDPDMTRDLIGEVRHFLADEQLFRSVDVCPVDCIHEADRILVIEPEECIDWQNDVEAFRLSRAAEVGLRRRRELETSRKPDASYSAGWRRMLVPSRCTLSGAIFDVDAGLGDDVRHPRVPPSLGPSVGFAPFPSVLLTLCRPSTRRSISSGIV
jgi:hypothetical protein